MAGAWAVTEVFLGLGSNLGDREANLRRAVELLPTYGVAIVEQSPVYDTAPVDAPPGSGRFLNVVCRVETTLPPLALLKAVKGLESALGRLPGPRSAPRTVDIDILLYGDQVVDTPELTIPHPRFAARAFVLAPLADIAPDAKHPVLGVRVCELLAAASGREEVVRWEADVREAQEPGGDPSRG